MDIPDPESQLGIPDKSVGSKWVVNKNQVQEKPDLGDFLQSKGTELEEDGAVNIDGEKINPDSEINTNVRYEKSSDGDKLHIEMRWEK